MTVLTVLTFIIGGEPGLEAWLTTSDEGRREEEEEEEKKSGEHREEEGRGAA